MFSEKRDGRKPGKEAMNIKNTASFDYLQCNLIPRYLNLEQRLAKSYITVDVIKRQEG